MTATLKHVGRHVVIVFLATFIGGLLTAQADWTHLTTVRSAAVAGVSAGLGAILASLQTPAAQTASTAIRNRLARVGRAVAWQQVADTHEAIVRARIYVVNQCATARVLDSDVRSWVKAITAQAHDFAHEWGINVPDVHFATHLPAADRADTVIVICDNADQAGALGYHSETADGVTYGRVFALDCQNAGVTISSCLSHEILEAVADLNVDRWVDGIDGRQWALEACDPVEADTYTDAGGVELSNYVLPAFFDDEGQAPFDKLGHLPAPFSLAKGGYAVVRKGSRAQQVYGDRRAYDAVEGWRHGTKVTALSRTARRLSKA